MAYDNNLQERELGWDDEIEEGSSYDLLPEGDYDFEVVNFERARHNGSAKLPPCPKAIVTLRVYAPDGLPVQVTNNFFLYTSCQGLNFDFFASIGLARRGQPFRMRWDEIIGRCGRAKFAPRKYTGADGAEHTSNSVKRFLPPDANKGSYSPATAQNASGTSYIQNAPTSRGGAPAANGAASAASLPAEGDF